VKARGNQESWTDRILKTTHNLKKSNLNPQRAQSHTTPPQKKKTRKGEKTNQEELAWMCKGGLGQITSTTFLIASSHVHASSCAQTIKDVQNTGFCYCPATEIISNSNNPTKMRQALHSSLALVSKNVFAQKWRKGSTSKLQTETQTMKSHVYYLLYKFLRQKVCDAQDLVQYRFVHVRSDSKASGAASGQGTGASHTMAACSKSEVWSIPHT